MKKQALKIPAKGWIKPSVAPFGTFVFNMRNKIGKFKMCIKLRSLNANTKLDALSVRSVIWVA